jgi:cytochrome P450
MEASAAMLLPDWAPRTPTERRFDRAMADFDALVADLVAERYASQRDAGRTNGGTASHESDGDSERGNGEAVSYELQGDNGECDDLLSTLLDAEFPGGTTMDESTVRDQLVTFLFAGHETTAVALTYAVWLLGGTPDAAIRLHEEVEAVCDGDPTFTDVPSLSYTERVVKEALRLYPPVHLLYRQPRSETTLGGYRIPADATLQLSTYHIQRDSRWWDAPEEFHPDRWTGENDRPEYAYFPFGGGPRHCIGMRFATLELVLALATLARRIEFERVTDDLDPEPKVTLEPGTVEMRIHHRD